MPLAPSQAKVEHEKSDEQETDRQIRGRYLEAAHIDVADAEAQRGEGSIQNPGGGVVQAARR